MVSWRLGDTQLYADLSSILSRLQEKERMEAYQTLNAELLILTSKRTELVRAVVVNNYGIFIHFVFRVPHNDKGAWEAGVQKIIKVWGNSLGLISFRSWWVPKSFPN